MKIYIAGKITGDLSYKLKFQEAAYELRKRGHVALNPAELPEGMAQRDYMRICFAMIDSADAVFLLPDWGNSKGAKLEAAYCQYIGKRILPKIGGLRIVEHFDRETGGRRRQEGGEDDHNTSGLVADE